MTEPVHRFAWVTNEPRLLHGVRALAILASHPRETGGILKSLISGKRVRARQALATLLGLDHRGLWFRPETRGLSLMATAGEDADLSAAVAVIPDLRSWADLLLSEAVSILLLCPPGHNLLPGIVPAIEAAFAHDAERQAIYGDALLLRQDGAAMPLLRPAFDPDYLMAVDYIGPVIALRRSGWESLGSPMDLIAQAQASDLVLRLATRFGPRAIGHCPLLLSWSRLDAAGEGGQVVHYGVIRAALDRAGTSGVDVVTEAGVLRLHRPLPPKPPLVSFIVPTRDRLDLLRPCLASLKTRTDWPAYEILICDNDSREPETLAYFHDLERQGLARIVPCPGAFNFAAMNNAAAHLAKGRVLAFINNDVEAIHSNWLERLVREALRPDVGAVGAKLIDAQGRIQHGGVLLGPGGLVTHAHRFFHADAAGYLAALSATRAVAAVTAACLVVEAEKFRRVGGFDAEAFAVDFNDVDLCLRLGRAGYRTLFVPSAVLNHFEGASRRRTRAAQERHHREVEAFRMRWGSLLAQDPHYHPGFDPDLGTYARLRRGWPDAGRVTPR